MKATEQYFPVVLFIMLYKVVLSFEAVDEILQLIIALDLVIALYQHFPGAFFLFFSIL